MAVLGELIDSRQAGRWRVHLLRGDEMFNVTVSPGRGKPVKFVLGFLIRREADARATYAELTEREIEQQLTAAFR